MNSILNQMVALAILSLASRTRSCNIDCGPGERCELVRSTCDYPPCPIVPICVGTESTVITRPGICPNTIVPNSGGSCMTQCRHDGDCQINEKCCTSGCSRLCRRVQRALTVKPGTCPWHLGRERTCENLCNFDADCGGTQKCCQTACGSRCSKPCFHWLGGSGTRFWSLPFICRRP